MAEGRIATLKEVPVEAIEQAIRNGVEELTAKIKRRNARGQLGYIISGINQKLSEILDGTFEKWLRDLAGGGQFYVDLTNPSDPLDRPIKPFEITIEGPMKLVDRSANAHLFGPTATMPVWQQPGWQPGAPPPVPTAAPQYTVPGTGYQAPGTFQAPPILANMPWAQGLSPADQWAVAQQLEAKLGPAAVAPGATLASDQMALRQIADLKAEVVQARAEKQHAEATLENERKVHQKEMTTLNERLDKIEKTAAEERHKAEMRVLEAKMDALATRKHDEPSTDWAKLAAALAPIGTAMITSSNTRDQEVQKLQFQTLQTMLAADKKKGGDGELLQHLAPILAPVLLQLVQNKSPEAQANLHATLMDAMMHNMSMTAQFVQSMTEIQNNAQGEMPWWVPIVQGAVSSLTDIATAWAAMKGDQAPKLPHGVIRRPMGLPAGMPGVEQGMPGMPGMPGASMPAPAAGGIYRNLDDAAGSAPPLSQPPVQQGPNPETVVRIIMMSPQLPREFKTPEWERVLLAIHRQENVLETAELTLGLLVHLQRFDRLPAQMGEVFDKPQEVLTAMIGDLPIKQWAPGYLKALIDALVMMITQDDEDEPEDAEEDEPEPEDAEVVEAEALVTPAPAETVTDVLPPPALQAFSRTS